MPSSPNRLKALVLGGVAWDLVVYVDTFPRPHPQTVFAAGSNESVGSSGAGKAMNLSYLGADVTLWALVGDDDAGRRIRREMKRRGVEFVGVADPAGTTRHVNLMDQDGERISIFANAGSDHYSVDVASMAPVAEAADLVSVTIANHCRPFLPMVRAMGKPIWVDLHDYDGVNPHHDEFIESADHLLMSSVAMLGWRRFLEDRIAAGARVAICTHGASGASGLSWDEGWVDLPSVPVPDVIDTNGAGDAFFAGFAVSWHRGGRLAASMEAGAKAAAAAVQSPDLAPPVGNRRRSGGDVSPQ
jgi:sugar/nucleoside kinase (ribokinase family)